MPPKRKAAQNPPNDSPSKRPALADIDDDTQIQSTNRTVASTRVQRTYGRRARTIPVELLEVENTTLEATIDGQTSDLEQDIDLNNSPSSPSKRRTRKRLPEQRETHSKRTSKRPNSDRGASSTPLRPKKRVPRIQPIVEIPILTRPSRPASPSLLHDQSSPPPSSVGEPASTPTTPQKHKLSHRPPPSPSKPQTLLSTKQLPSRFHPCLNSQKKAILRMLHDSTASIIEDKEEYTDKSAENQLEDLLNGTIARSEGNSCLLLGPRGSGKSGIIERCLKSISEPPIIIRLSGWVHHSDRLAMREIAYQLGQQTGKSFLQTNDDEDDNLAEQDTNPFLETAPAGTGLVLPPPSHLPALISVIPTLSRPTVVVLDAFDLFALHPRQALLYCLLDTVQGCRTGTESKGLAVVGVTTRIDTINLLEKRVKSRFSGRIIRTTVCSKIKHWLSLTRGILCPDITSTTTEPDTISEWNDAWRNRVSELLDEKAVIELIQETAGLTKDPRSLLHVLVYAVTRLTLASPFPSSGLFSQAILSQRSRPPLFDTLDLPYPSMCLLIASMHAITSGHEIFTFEMLFSTFRNQLRASVAAPVQVNGGSIGMVKCNKAILLSAFEHLIVCHIFVPVAAPSSSTAKEFTRYRSNLGKEEVKKIVEKTGQVTLKKWLSKAE